MSQQLVPFGAGTRACPGRYQALLVLRATIAALVTNFDVGADPRETNEETMAPIDTFVSVRPPLPLPSFSLLRALGLDAHSGACWSAACVAGVAPGVEGVPLEVYAARAVTSSVE